MEEVLGNGNMTAIEVDAVGRMGGSNRNMTVKQGKAVSSKLKGKLIGDCCCG